MFMTSPDQTPQHNQLPPFPDPEQQRNFDTAVANIREWLSPAAAQHYDWEGNPVETGITRSVTFSTHAASRYVTENKEERLRIQTVNLSDKDRARINSRSGIRDDDFEIVHSLNPTAKDPAQRGLMFREVPGGKPYTGGGHPPVEMTADDYSFLANEIPVLYRQARARGEVVYPTQVMPGPSRLAGFAGRIGLRLRGKFGGSDKPGS
jgi:hypothetical protein